MTLNFTYSLVSNGNYMSMAQAIGMVFSFVSICLQPRVPYKRILTCMHISRTHNIALYSVGRKCVT